MSSFFNQLSQIETRSSKDPALNHNNPHAVATPGEISAAERLLQDQFTTLFASSTDETHRQRLERWAEELQEQIEGEKAKPDGVPQSYLDALERVDKRKLKKGDSCPICAENFLDDQFPLVVQLPCHPTHKFDLECVGPWLRLQGTCPLDRKELMKKKEVSKPSKVEGDEEEFDDMYA